MSLGILILRLAVGLTMAAHGLQKLTRIEHVAPAMESLGFVPGRRAAWMAGLTESGGGVLLALGLATPGAAAVIAGVMLVAGVSAHAKQGFFAQNRGYEYTLVLGVAALAIAFTGPGSFSIDALLGLDVSGPTWGLAAMGVGLVGGVFQLATRRPPQAQKG